MTKKYIWNSSQDSCEKCQALDKTEYLSEEDIPDKPHPNCKCYVEVLEDTTCDCIEDFQEKFNEIMGDAKLLQHEINVKIAYFMLLLETARLTPAQKALLISCIDALNEIFGAVDDFVRNYQDMRKADIKYSDKYFHSKANCDAAKRGELGRRVAETISNFREFADQFKNVLLKGMTIAESIEDSIEDQKANIYGRKQGQKYPDVDSRVLVDIYRPNGLPEKY